ncbi:hypothetical protein PP613_23485 [Mycobacteroides abscessus]|nr:hypothetical protein [Mycobacteroides abscessus]MDM2412306.1 hypothetical protein [Mycobacteroides abscessus]
MPPSLRPSAAAAWITNQASEPKESPLTSAVRKALDKMIEAERTNVEILAAEEAELVEMGINYRRGDISQ